MASSRPGSRNLAEKPASKSQSDLKRNGEVKNSSDKQKKHSTSGRQSQNLDFASHESQSHEKQGQRSQSQQSQRRSSSSQKEAGCLEILASEGSFPVLLQPKNRPTSGSTAKKAPSINRINSAPRRTPTPTKQIILEAAKRKQEPTLSLEETSHRMRPNGATTGGDEVKDPGQRSPKAHIRTKEDEKKDDEDDDDEEDEEEESSSEEELIKAPNELMMEFLDCVLKEDYVNGLKLCTMILLYEPDNADALAFRSLIEEKMAIDISNQAEDEDDDESEEDDDEDDDDEDDSSEDDSDSSDSSSDDDDDDSDGEDETEVKTKAKTKAKTNARTIFVP